MITEDVGKLILSTQGDVKRFKDQLLSFASNNLPSQGPLNPNKDVQILYERLQIQIEKLENNLDNKLDFLFKSVLNDNNITAQKLPVIPAETNGKTGVLSINNSQKNIKEAKVPQKAQSFRADFISEPLSKLLYKRKPTKKPSKAAIQNLQPSAQPDITSLLSAPSYQTSGLLSLINQGKISKEVDLSPFLQNEHPFLSNKPLKYHEHKEKFVKQTISLMKDLPFNTVFDINNLKSLKSEEITNKNEENLVFFPKLSQDKRIHKKNLQFSQKTEKSSQKSRFSEKIPNFDENINIKKPFILTYPEVLDAYSLHQFIIRKGRTLEETPEFQSYKRICGGIWLQISSIIKSLEKLMSSYDIPLAYIDGKKLAKLAIVPRKTHDINELMDIIVNSEEINKVLKIPSRMFMGINGKNIAVLKIQSFWRMWACKRDYRRIRVLIEKARIIQRSFRLFLQYKQTKFLIKQRNQQEIDLYFSLAGDFKANWPQIKLNKRIEIHINSFSFQETRRLTMEKFLQRQNNQMTRIFNIRDPLVEIIYISPFDLPAEIINYYHKVMSLGDLNDYKDRIHFIWPENHINFPSHFSTARLLLYSPKAIKRIKGLIKGKEAFIVPGFPSNDDIKLAAILNIAIFAGDPQKSFAFSNKSAAKRLFLNCDIPCPPGAYEIYDEKELINSLTILIANNLNINTWVFKIDDEFNGRGISWFSVNSVGFFKELRKKGGFEVNEAVLARIREVLVAVLPVRVKFATPSLYPNWKEFLMHFLRKGGIIEAMPNEQNSSISSPSISFMIEPNGEISLITAYEKISGKEYVNVAMSFPQKSLHEINLKAVSQVLGQSLYTKGIFGYITVDLIAFPDPFSAISSNNVLFWAIGLDCYLNHYTSGFFYFDFLMKGKLDEINGKYHILAENNERSFIYCPFLHHPGLSNIQYKTFFHMCRIENISFDLERKIGSSFVLLDSLQTGVVGLLAVAENEAESLRFTNNAFKFLMQQSGSVNMKYFNNQENSRSDNLHILDIVSRIKLMYKKKLKMAIKSRKNEKDYNSQYL